MSADLYACVEPPLFPPAGERARVDALLTDALSDLHERIARGPVMPDCTQEDIARELAQFDFSRSLRLDELISWLVQRMERGLVHVTHPRYFGLFNPGPTFAAQCADRIAAAFNPQLATWTTSPFAVGLERHVIHHVAARAGLPPSASGHFTTGGSEANATALICALTAAHPAFARVGARCFGGQPTLYISREAHLAWIKIAHQTGIGRDAVRLVATDGQGRMCAAALAAQMASDRAEGRVPVLAVGTAGTTGAGMIDPLAACGEASREHGVWFHVDAAWAGAAIASDRLRPALGGIEAADSITIDAHKWFATTMGCGMFLVRDPSVLSQAFGVSTTYMPSNLEQLDPYVTTIQWSRRFLGVRLFVSLGVAGWAGYAAHVERAVDLAHHIGAELSARGWGVANDSPVAVLCLEPPPGSPEPQEIVRHVQASGAAFVSLATFEGRRTIRVCVTHGAATYDDASILVDALETARRE